MNPNTKQVAGSPELYPVLVDGGCMPTLLALLSHENGDIAADVLELLAELTGAGEGGGGAGAGARGWCRQAIRYVQAGARGAAPRACVCVCVCGVGVGSRAGS